LLLANCTLISHHATIFLAANLLDSDNARRPSYRRCAKPIRTSPKNHAQILSIDRSFFGDFFADTTARDTTPHARALTNPALGAISAKRLLSARKAHVSPCGSSSPSAPRSEGLHAPTVPGDSRR
jgi:hypothetical protein